MSRLALSAAAFAIGYLASKVRPAAHADPGDAAGGVDLTEVGKAGGDLRLWRAREALRHAELRLGVQVQAMQALEGRATSMIGWSVSVGLALGAAAFNTSLYQAAAGSAAACLFAAALLCIGGLARRDWSGPGYRPADVLADTLPNELFAVEAMVSGYQAAVTRNSCNFNRFKLVLNVAMAAIVAAPVSGLVGYWLTVRPVVAVRL